MAEKYLLDEPDPEDSAAYPNFSVIRTHFGNYPTYKLNAQVYSPDAINRPLFEHFVSQRQVFTQVLNPKSEDLVAKLFSPKPKRDVRAVTIEEQTNFLDSKGVFLDVGTMIKESIESDFSLKIFRDCLESTLAVYFSTVLDSYVFINYNKMAHCMDFYTLRFPSAAKNPELQRFWSAELETPQVIRGLKTFVSEKTACLLIKFHNSYLIYAVSETPPEGEGGAKVKLREFSRVAFKENFIYRVEVNEVTDSVVSLLVSANLTSRKLVVCSVAGKLTYEVELPGDSYRSIQVFGPRDEILVANSSSISLIDPRKNHKNTLLNFREEGEKNCFVHNAFYFDNYKMFGIVTDSEIRFTDFRFPKNGILSFGHSLPVPPEHFVQAKNLRHHYLLQGASDSQSLDHLFSELTMAQEEGGNAGRFFLYSLRRGGCALTFPYFDYQEKEDIKNQFVYKLIKEINTSCHRHNKFLNLLSQDVNCCQLFGGSLCYPRFTTSGFQAFEEKGRVFVASVEKNSVFNLQIIEKGSKKWPEFYSFKEFSYPDAFEGLFKFHAEEDRFQNLAYFVPPDEMASNPEDGPEAGDWPSQAQGLGKRVKTGQPGRQGPPAPVASEEGGGQDVSGWIDDLKSKW